MQKQLIRESLFQKFREFFHSQKFTKYNIKNHRGRKFLANNVIFFHGLSSLYSIGANDFALQQLYMLWSLKYGL